MKGSTRLFLLALSLLSVISCRRPDVVEKREADIIDFEFIKRPTITSKVPEGEKKQPLTPELFSPYFSEKNNYRISSGDVLEISVFGDEDLVRETVVAPDGKVYFMFADGIPAAGRTLKELASDITTKLSTVYLHPDVTILPKYIASQYYMILGKVGRPNAYPITASMTLRQAIGEAGGIAYGGYKGTTIQVASLKDSFIVRKGKKLDVDFAKLLYSEGADQDIYVQPGDYIYIASSLVNQLYLIGAVREQKPIPYKDGITLVQAISGPAGMSGGFFLGNPYGANLSQIMIIRGSLTSPRVMKVDFFKIIAGEARDVYLEPGDIIYVPNKKFRFMRSLVHAAISNFVSSFGSSAGNYYASEKWFKSGP